VPALPGRHAPPSENTDTPIPAHTPIPAFRVFGVFRGLPMRIERLSPLKRLGFRWRIHETACQAYCLL
jgi:hypothetical protein